MASHRRPKQPSRARVTVLTTAAAAAVVLSAQAANAAPSAKPSKDEVKSKVDKLYEEAEKATEAYDGAKEKQDKLEKDISTLQDKVARGQDELNQLRDGIGTMASAQYRSGSIDPSIQLFLSADPDDYLDKASTLDQLSGQQVEALKKIQEKQRELAQERQEATDKLKDLASTRTELGKKKKEVQGKLADAQKLLNSLTAQERAALQADQARASRDSMRNALSGSTASASGRAGAAFAAAQSVIGSPYVYGASGPSSFDCSGLTSWAYAQAGVSIPRTSQAQANAGTRIYSQSDLRVGDLVLFYGDLHHIGLYAGNGQVLHAPHTGASVRYESIGNMPFQFGVRI
ncbi:NlpC/P60 family protein [Streptomyces sp. NPDC003631]|uniref:C40 family peptidase n=5 Tax=Streptomyces TaxID=1883 RepID=A0ABP7JZD9_9ACTN|nr:MULTISPECIES: C40 family peptidase [unclassified Streptomyces]MBW8704002.1 putative endopeptidase [Streptomyces sp. MBT84]MDX3261391.1 NlpC/P60 family protein [Streptomyces sp. MI02-2A]MEE1669111.1 NlpC/P60 family protein [Streptomyces sp. WAC07094]REE60194.1 cell wall-associated NlpC family hydrolase [Streptomyces sp. 3212.3]